MIAIVTGKGGDQYLVDLGDGPGGSTMPTRTSCTRRETWLRWPLRASPARLRCPCLYQNCQIGGWVCERCAMRIRPFHREREGRLSARFRE